MKRLLAVVVGVACLALVARAAEMKAPAIHDPGFDKLRSLTGDWQGTDANGKPVHVSYRPTAGGTCMMETLVAHEGEEMITMYFMDAKRLTMTHYCTMGNQPRMRSGPVAADAQAITFDFVDAANMASKDDAHMHRLAFRFQDADHFSQEWLMKGAGKDMPVTFNFTRTKA